MSDQTTQRGLDHNSPEVITSPNRSLKKSVSLQSISDVHSNTAPKISDVHSNTATKSQQTGKTRQLQFTQKSNNDKAKTKTFSQLGNSRQAEIAMLKVLFPLPDEDNCTPPFSQNGICSQHLTQEWCPVNLPPSRIYKSATTNLHKDIFEDAHYATLKHEISQLINLQSIRIHKGKVCIQYETSFVTYVQQQYQYAQENGREEEMEHNRFPDTDDEEITTTLYLIITLT